MTKEEFIVWLDKTSSYTREGRGDDDWRYMTDYADYTFDYIEIEGDKVILRYEEKHWGYTSYEQVRYSFEEFIERYNNDTLK